MPKNALLNYAAAGLAEHAYRQEWALHRVPYG